MDSLSNWNADRAARIAQEILQTASLTTDFVSSYNSFLSDLSCDSVFDDPIERVDCSRYTYTAPQMDGCNYIPCILGDGSRRFIKSIDASNDLSSSLGFEAEHKGCLLQKPIEVLAKEAENRQIKTIALKHTESRVHIPGDIDARTRGESLWVDKYAPSSFSQLLSGEKVNRDVLKALKSWDEFVFKKSGESSDSLGDSSSFGAHSKESSGDHRQMDFNFDDRSDDSDGDDDDGDRHAQSKHSEGDSGKGGKKRVDKRPKQKLILLSGSPGTGKTTLAHILARHCGYRPLEVNASDDRSAEKIRNVIYEATQSNTINGDSLPNCLILDEIDGIDNRKAIDAIVEIVKAPLQSNKGKRSAGDRSFALTRPIFCICNDLYAPVLRDLRPHCAIFNFQPPTENRLVMRLKQICTSEGMNVSTSDLTQLCHSTGGDIRSSINTLQFASIDFKNRVESGEISVNNVNSALHQMLSSGLKDDQSSSFFLWNVILSSQELGHHMSKLKAQSQAASESFFNSESAEEGKIKASAVDELLRLTEEFGDNALITAGVFENRLSIHYSDPTFVKTDYVSEWISSIDSLDGTMSEGVYSSKYACALYGVVHIVASSDKRIKISYPRKEREMQYNILKCKNIIRSMQELRPENRNLMSNSVIIMDLVSFLIRIISPMFKSHSVASFNDVDKQAFKLVVDTMVAFGLNYNASGAKAFEREKKSIEIEPPINVLINFTENIDAFPINSIAQDIKLAIAYEIKRSLLEKSVSKIGSHGPVVHSASSMPAPTPSQSNSPSKPEPAKKPPLEDLSKLKSSKLNFFSAQKRSADSISPANGGHSNAAFSANSNNAAEAAAKKARVVFRFNKGFSNAVKRPVTINDFL